MSYALSKAKESSFDKLTPAARQAARDSIAAYHAGRPFWVGCAVTVSADFMSDSAGASLLKKGLRGTVAELNGGESRPDYTDLGPQTEPVVMPGPVPPPDGEAPAPEAAAEPEPLLLLPLPPHPVPPVASRITLPKFTRNFTPGGFHPPSPGPPLKKLENVTLQREHTEHL